MTLSDIIKRADPPFPCYIELAFSACSGPVVPCHPNMQAMGKGTGIKAGDAVAAGCQSCHHEIDNGRTLTREQAQWYQMRGFMRTYLEAVRRGCITFSAEGRPVPSRKLADLPVMGAKRKPPTLKRGPRRNQEVDKR